jgi:uncharacterized membrane protein YgaE (UPF0421/DUF939 family)
MSENSDFMTPKMNDTFQIQAFTKQFELLTKVMKKLKDDMDSMKKHINEVDQRRFNMSNEEKQRLRVSNIYYHNASMRLDKEHEVERLAKIYTETNKKHEEWRALFHSQKDEK